jgi:hypothetical protein
MQNPRSLPMIVTPDIPFADEYATENAQRPPPVNWLKLNVL